MVDDTYLVAPAKESRYIADAASPSVAMEGFAVVYHAPSGATHVLGSPVPEILGVIAPEQGAATIAGIVARLQADYELDGDVIEVVTARLAELEAAGLVRRV
ncbi:MAG TPA: HPr-rel-A system PqqD family peptide chaperone [Sphingomonas sp.]|jgi:PqqD family protein of HPr-rel-A system|uniref:HPr-rel-A system PqqD family peptide chaperone n=1 Tax=Sphingomonas sp. TaxID=28214 RepID=UPI002ED7A0D7